MDKFIRKIKEYGLYLMRYDGKWTECTTLDELMKGARKTEPENLMKYLFSENVWLKIEDTEKFASYIELPENYKSIHPILSDFIILNVSYLDYLGFSMIHQGQSMPKDVAEKVRHHQDFYIKNDRTFAFEMKFAPAQAWEKLAHQQFQKINDFSKDYCFTAKNKQLYEELKTIVMEMVEEKKHLEEIV